MTTPIKYEIAKLIKEKGFDEECSHAYKEVETPVLYVHQDKKYNNSFKKEWQNTVRKNSHMDNAIINRYSAPTIAEVVMWIYEKHGIWIDVSLNQFSKPKDLQWMYSIVFIENCTYSHSPKSYNTPTEAYESAIVYVLTEIIK
jgi:hypothetical protein